MFLFIYISPYQNLSSSLVLEFVQVCSFIISLFYSLCVSLFSGSMYVGYDLVLWQMEISIVMGFAFAWALGINVLS